MSNTYSLLLDLLTPEPMEGVKGLFGTIAAVSPLMVRIRGRTISRGLFYQRGTTFRQEDIGAEVALLPCEEGFLILFQTEGGGV